MTPERSNFTSVQGLAHAAGMLIAYIPSEKIVVQADLYNPLSASASTRVAGRFTETCSVWSWM